jgi:hypothetical protein
VKKNPGVKEAREKLEDVKKEAERKEQASKWAVNDKWLQATAIEEAINKAEEKE